jgi:hypothetical protein
VPIIQRKIRNLLSDFDNDGFIFQDYNGANTNTGTFVNDGVVEDLRESFELVLSSTTNNGVIAGPLHRHYVVGISSQGLLLGHQMGVTPGTFYFGELTLTNPVGSSHAIDSE